MTRGVPHKHYIILHEDPEHLQICREALNQISTGEQELLYLYVHTHAHLTHTMHIHARVSMNMLMHIYVHNTYGVSMDEQRCTYVFMHTHQVGYIPAFKEK